MFSRRLAFSTILIAAVLGACSAREGGLTPSNGQMVLPSIDSDLLVTAALPPKTVGEELPSEGLGSIKSPYWKATLGGFTQQQFSQSLAFPPGTKITLRNLSKNTPHTLDVIAKIAGPPAKFPAHPSLPIAAHGKGVLGIGYASGSIAPGKSVTITLSHAGTYMIGCAFHYSLGMRDVFVVSTTGKPGQQATPPPHGTTKPSPTPTSKSSYQPSYAP
jgi:plastocyanin